MPSVGNIIKTTVIQELGDVQLSNSLFWRVQDLGADPSLDVGLLDVLTGFYDSVKAIMAPAWGVTCGIYENLSALEPKQIAFLNLAGLGTGDSHPQDQVVRIDEYGQEAPGSAIVRGWLNLSGTVETLSTSGRVNEVLDFQDVELFLSSQQVFGANWTLIPVLQQQTAPGPPPVVAYRDAILAQVNPTYRKLRSRKTSLCAQS